MARRKIFPDCKTTEFKLIMPVDKVEVLRAIAGQNGLSLTDYVRSLCFVHLARITQNNTESQP